MSNVESDQAGRDLSSLKATKTHAEARKNVASTSSIFTKSAHRKGLIRQYTASVIAAISYVIVGTALGWPSPVLYYAKSEGSHFNLTTLDGSLMVSLYYAGCFIMPLPTGYLINLVGYKASILYVTIVPVIAFVLAWVSQPTVLIHLSRLLLGIYSGLTTTVLPLYMGEIAEPHVRGKVASFLQLFLNFGCVFSYVVGAQVSYGAFAIILGTLPVVHFITVLFIPESPYWLTNKGKHEKAAKSLAWLRGKKVEAKEEELEEEKIQIVRTVQSDIRIPPTFMSLFTAKNNRKAMIIVEVISACQRLAGISTLLAYIAVTVPALPGLTANHCAIITGCSNIVGVLVAIPLIDRLGRLPLLKASCIGSGLTMVAAAVWYGLYDSIRNEAPANWLPIAIFCVYGFCMNIGLGPIPGLMQGEMFSPNLKSKASAITVMVVSLSSIISNFIYTPLAESAGLWSNFFIYSLFCFGCLVFVWTYAFETKGKTLLEIQQHLER